MNCILNALHITIKGKSQNALHLMMGGGGSGVGWGGVVWGGGEGGAGGGGPN